MKFGMNFPPFGEYGDARTLAELGHEAEEAGWDAMFTWDHVWLGLHEPFVDPWVGLAAVAMATSRIRIGTVVTPLPRRRPWKLARETVSLDRLSEGRLTLGVGLGNPSDVEFEHFGDEGDLKVRGEMLDEGLEVLAGLWSGEPFSFQGKHYRVEETVFLPRPAQSPRIPVWVASSRTSGAPLRRAARWDGVFPDLDTTPDDVRRIAGYIGRHRTSSAPFDVALSKDIVGLDRHRQTDVVAEFAEAGATWLVQSMGPNLGSLDEVRTLVRRGPPRG